jgi:ketosteroid isomerase-like protein
MTIAAKTASPAPRAPGRNPQAEELMMAYYAAFNARDFAAYPRLFAPDVELVSPGASMRGVEATVAFDRAWTLAFPEARIESLKRTSAGPLVVTANWFHGGPHRGVLRGGPQDVPPTGNIFDVPYCSMFTVENGKIVRQQLMYEMSFVPVQLGLL